MFEEFEENIRKVLFVDDKVTFDEGYNPWILEPLIPNEAITILDGLGGSGKSWFALDLAYSIVSGGYFLDKFPVWIEGPVLYLTAEEVPQVFLQRVRTVLKHYPKGKGLRWLSLLHEDIELSPYICKKNRGEQIRTLMFEALELLISETLPVLVVLDSLINFYGLDENSSEDAMFFYDVLKYFIRKYKTSFLLLHHQNKEGMRAQADDVISFRGSGVLREQARSRIVYKNIKIDESTIAKKIILEKSNYYSSFRDSLPIYLKFEDGAHKYDKQFELIAKRVEEEFKAKGKKNKKDNGGLGEYDIDF